MPKRVWLNIDLGELAEEPVQLYGAAHVANIACGGHAGNADSMRAALQACRAAGTGVGAHPAYPDRASFGRQRMELPLADLGRSLAEQYAQLQSLAQEVAVPVQWLKPHGALYHAANEDGAIAKLLCQTAQDAFGQDLCLIGPDQGELRAAAQELGMDFWSEVFPDRGRRRDAQGPWQLVPRGEVGAVLDRPEAILAQLEAMLREAQADSMCLHGDNPASVSVAAQVRERLDQWAAG